MSFGCTKHSRYYFKSFKISQTFTLLFCSTNFVNIYLYNVQFRRKRHPQLDSTFESNRHYLHDIITYIIIIGINSIIIIIISTIVIFIIIRQRIIMVTPSSAHHQPVFIGPALVELVANLCEELDFGADIEFSTIDTINRYFEECIKHELIDVDAPDPYVVQQNALLTLLITMNLCCKFMSSDTRLSVSQIQNYLHSIRVHQQPNVEEIKKYELSIFQTLQFHIRESPELVSLTAFIMDTETAYRVAPSDMLIMCTKILRVFFARRKQLYSKRPWASVNEVAASVLIAATMLFGLSYEVQQVICQRLMVIDKNLSALDVIRFGTIISNKCT